MKENTESTTEIKEIGTENAEEEMIETEEKLTDNDDGGWEVVSRRKQPRAVLTPKKSIETKGEEYFEKHNSGQQIKKARLSILDRLSNYLSNEKVVPVDRTSADQSLEYLRGQWKNWVFGRVIRIQGMYAFFFLSVIQTMSKSDEKKFKDDELADKIWDVFYGAVAIGTPIYAYRKINELNELEKEYKRIQLGGESYGGIGVFPPYLKVYNPQMFQVSKVMTGLVGLSGPTLGTLRLGGAIQKRKSSGVRRTSST